MKRKKEEYRNSLGPSKYIRNEKSRIYAEDVTDIIEKRRAMFYGYLKKNI